jgi:hypothetical protein
MELATKTLKSEGILDGQFFSDNRFIKEGLETVVRGMRVVGLLPPEGTIPWDKIIDKVISTQIKDKL